MNHSKKSKRIMNLINIKLKKLENDLVGYPLPVPSLPSKKKRLNYIHRREIIEKQILLLLEIIEISNETIFLDD